MSTPENSGLIETADARGLVRAAVLRAIAPLPPLTVSEWADANRVLTSETSAAPGPYRTAAAPYLREPMDVMSVSDPTEEVVIMKGTQVGASELGMNFLGYVIDHAPGPAMLVLPTSASGKRSSKTRLSHLIERTPSIREKISDKRRDGRNAALLKLFPGGLLVIAGANSATELKSQPVRFLFCDEVDEYPIALDNQGPALALAEKRTDTYRGRKKILKVSTPTTSGKSQIDEAWERSDQRHYHVPCPHCGGFQSIEWERIKYAVAEDGYIEDVWLECVHCETRIHETAKLEMLSKGRWVASAPGRGKPAGFHIPSLLSSLGYSWQQAVVEFREAEKDPTGEKRKVFENSVLGIASKEIAERPDVLALVERAEDYEYGIVPRGGLVLTAFTDVQADRLEVLVRAWGEGEESWLVAHEVLNGDTEGSAVWAEHDKLLSRSFEHESGAKLAIEAAGIDSGYRTQTVYDYCYRKSSERLIPTKGVTGERRPILGRPTPQDLDHKGHVIPKAVRLWPIGVDVAKEKLYARLALKHPGPGFLHFPMWLPDDYYKQLTAEEVATKWAHGFPKRRWQKKPGQRNEALDLEVGAYAVAIFAGVRRTDWAKRGATVLAQAAREKQPEPSKSQTPAYRPPPRNWVTDWHGRR